MEKYLGHVRRVQSFSVQNWKVRVELANTLVDLLFGVVLWDIKYYSRDRVGRSGHMGRDRESLVLDLKGGYRRVCFCAFFGGCAHQDIIGDPVRSYLARGSAETSRPPRGLRMMLTSSEGRGIRGGGLSAGHRRRGGGGCSLTALLVAAGKSLWRWIL